MQRWQHCQCGNNLILGIGTDLVRVERFAAWAHYPSTKIERIFSAAELQDCLLQNGQYSPEKLAVRFAAKEAFYKALSAALFKLELTDSTFSLLATCKAVSVSKDNSWDLPQLVIDWSVIGQLVKKAVPQMQAQLSISHETTLAVAFVTLSR